MGSGIGDHPCVCVCLCVCVGFCVCVCLWTRWMVVWGGACVLAEVVWFCVIEVGIRMWHENWVCKVSRLCISACAVG